MFRSIYKWSSLKDCNIYIYEMSFHVRSSLWPPHREFERPLSWHCLREVFMRYVVESTSYDMVFIPWFVTIGPGIRVILRLLPQLFERLQCWYYWWEEFVKYAVQMASVACMHPKFNDDRFSHSSNVKVITSKMWECIVLVLRGL
jgi:hypothetical protein